MQEPYYDGCKQKQNQHNAYEGQYGVFYLHCFKGMKFLRSQKNTQYTTSNKLDQEAFLGTGYPCLNQQNKRLLKGLLKKIKNLSDICTNFTYSCC